MAGTPWLASCQPGPGFGSAMSPDEPAHLPPSGVVADLRRPRSIGVSGARSLGGLMRSCDVLGCPGRATQVMRMTPPGNAFLRARLCEEHYDAIGRGERWLGARTGGCDDVAVLMGDDLPPLVRNYTCTSGHFSDRGQTDVVSLELVHGDGSTTQVEFELDPEAARSLGIWLGGVTTRSPDRSGAGRGLTGSRSRPRS